MPLYYFDCYHLSCREECIGHTLSDDEAAHLLAVQFAGEILQHEPEALTDGHDLTVTVSDEHRRVLFSFMATSTASARTKSPGRGQGKEGGAAGDPD